MDKKIILKETIEVFLTNTIYDIVNKKETPRINFIFNKEAYNLFYETMKNPIKLKNGWSPKIKEENIHFLKISINKKYPSIYIKDHIKFFTYLTEIINNDIKQYTKYGIYTIPRSHLICILKRIWLRMGTNDFNNIENFLYKQLLFTQNDLFENYKFNINKEHIINYYHDYKIIAENNLNKTWDESTKYMSFKIIKDNNIHSLPNIYYDIIDDNCYIYAIQNNKELNKIPEINKLIYKEFRGNSQPNKVYALKLFINMLKENGIKNIKVPTIQILNYDYHILLSEKTKEAFNKTWSDESLHDLSLWEKEQYEIELNWYNHIVNKEDTISKIKTEDLINLFYKVVKEDQDLLITNDIDINDTLDIKILKNTKKLS